MHHTGLSNCGSMVDQNADCVMDIAEHLNAWNHLLVAILTTSLLGIFLAVVWFYGYKLILFKNIIGERGKYYLRNHELFKFYNYFIQLFARGIMQPKVFA